jgi:hypothetical protein
VHHLCEVVVAVPLVRRKRGGGRIRLHVDTQARGEVRDVAACRLDENSAQRDDALDNDDARLPQPRDVRDERCRRG